MKKDYWIDWLDYFVSGKLYEPTRELVPEEDFYPLMFLEIFYNPIVERLYVFKCLDMKGELRYFRAITNGPPQIYWKRVK